jgi:hypothetical protein
VGQVRLLTKVCFVCGDPNGTVPQSILQVHGVDQSIRPKTGWETRGVKKNPYHDAEGLAQTCNSAILRGSGNRAGRGLVLEAVSGQKEVEDVDGWLHLRG